MPNFHLYSAFWGDHYLDLFKRACFRSLNWPKNQAAIKGSTWNILTRKEHFEEITKLFDPYDYKVQLIDIGDSQRVAGCGFVKTTQCDAGVILLNGLRNEIAYSLQNNSRMIMAPPDTLFGDGTIPNMLKVGKDPGSCVAIAHPRVLPSILDDVETIGATRGAITNPQLVTMAFKHAHDSFKYAQLGHEKNNSYIGGISWDVLDVSTWSVSHKLPTAYLADFIPSDYDFYWSQVSFGGWDHRWPAENLIRQSRQRYVGSSDACFVVEITDHDKNVPPKLVENAPKDGTYWNDHYHNGINKQFSVTFRGE